MSYLFYFTAICCLIFWIEGPYLFLPKSMIIRRNPAEELEKWLKNFDWSNKAQIKTSSRLPAYKFYSDIVEVLLLIARKMGGTYQESLMFLRESLQTDRQFEKKIRGAILGIYFQMLSMMLLTWIFIGGALNLVDVSFNFWNLFLILFWQLIGVGLLPLILSQLRKIYFADIGVLWKIMFILKSLAKVPLSRSEVLSYAGIQDLASIKQSSLSDIVMKLMETCQRTLKLGKGYDEDLKYLMEELRFREKYHFELFEKRLTVIKLILLSIFFLPSYLVFIFLLLSDLMALM